MAQTSGGGLGMTTVYTHTRPETKRGQLDQALSQLPAVKFLDQWLSARGRADSSERCELDEVWVTRSAGSYHGILDGSTGSQKG